MRRVRRLVPLALAAVLGVTVLAGCRSEPNVAAYVGGRQYTLQQIDDMVDEFVDLLPEARQSEIDLGQGRRLAVQSLVIDDVARRLAADKGIAVKTADRAAVLEQFGVPEGEELADRVVASAFATALTSVSLAVAALEPTAQAVEPTEADQREVYTSLKTEGKITTQPFADIQRYLTVEAIGKALGLRSVLRDAVAKYDVVVNPKYAPLGFPVQFALANGQVETYVSVPLVDR